MLRSKTTSLLCSGLALLLGSCPSKSSQPEPDNALAIGDTLQVTIDGLAPLQHYEVRLYRDTSPGGRPAQAGGAGPAAPPSRAEAISFARVTSNQAGSIPRFALWYHTGVVGCAAEAPDPQALRFRTFDEAERALAGKSLYYSVHRVTPGAKPGVPPLSLPAGPAELTQRVPIRATPRPLVYPSDAGGCLRNGQASGAEPVYVSGRGFQPDEELDVFVVPDQRGWLPTDEITDVSGPQGAAAPERVRADASGRFTAAAWPAGDQRPGTYDLVVRRRPAWPGLGSSRGLSSSDVVTPGLESGLVLYLPRDSAAKIMPNLAARRIEHAPYGERTEALGFSEPEVYAVPDPTRMPPGGEGARYAAFHVVPHREVAGWRAGAVPLADLSGGVEIVPLKPGALAASDVPIMPGPLPLGDYDIVVELAAANAVETGLDGVYQPATDLLDGGDQVAFTVGIGPYLKGALPVGRASYSYDDYFPAIGEARDVDLRAVVRYPATLAADDAPVMSGAHPLFLFLHGNSDFCLVQQTSVGGLPREYTHETCPQRKPNHLGHVELMERLASHGIIAVSIDAYDLNREGPIWVDERAQLILRHLELWANLARPGAHAGYPDPFQGRFAGHVDVQRTGLGGHSRGGEAAVAAARLSTEHPVSAVAALAPSDHDDLVPPDVPLLMVVPAADGDLRDLPGVRLYDRAGGEDGRVTKAGAYLYGANHDFFNSLWAAERDDSLPSRAGFIPADEQRRMGDAFVSAFVRAFLLGDYDYLDVFRENQKFPSISGYESYTFFHDAVHLPLERGDGTRALAEGVTALPDPGPSVHATQALRVRWDGEGTLTYALRPEERDLTRFSVLSLRVAQSADALNSPELGQDLRVELAGGGRRLSFSASRFGPLPAPYRLTPSIVPNLVMTTVRIPLSAFALVPDAPPLDKVEAIRLRFGQPKQGEIYLDDLELTR